MLKSSNLTKLFLLSFPILLLHRDILCHSLHLYRDLVIPADAFLWFVPYEILLIENLILQLSAFFKSILIFFSSW